MTRFLTVSPFLIALILGLVLGVTAMLRGIDRQLQRKGRVALFNTPSIAAFATVAGAVGYPLARYSQLEISTVSTIAAASGLAGAIGMFGLLAGWVVPSAARDVQDVRFALQGHFGRVTEEIGVRASGKISYEQGGTRHVLPALGLDGQQIESGVDVVIERIEDGIAHVAPWSTIARELELPA
ncbi:MAG: hypothetical protein H7Z74_17165 [Anaerolineae bacterium]|nr:hypothetical protein [Gemmatimonadaceae bacterium]